MITTYRKAILLIALWIVAWTAMGYYLLLWLDGPRAAFTAAVSIAASNVTVVIVKGLMR